MAAPLETKNTVVDISPEEVRQTLTRIIRSKYFSHAPKKQKFVQLICDYYLQGRATELNEYLIGCEVFEKGTGYNPSVDPVVRVGAHDVRKKLELYYQNEGAADAVRLMIPVGTYVPIFVRTATAPDKLAASNIAKPELPPSAIPQIPPSQQKATNRLFPFLATNLFSGVAQQVSRSVNKLLLLSGFVIIVLMGVITWLLLQPRTIPPQIAGNKSWQAKDLETYKTVWGPFLDSQSSTLLILSNPMVYRPVNAADPESLAKQGIALAPEQTNLIENLSNNRLPMRPNQSMQLVPAVNMYTGIGEAIGVFRISSLLHTLGGSSLLKQSRIVGPNDLKDNNVVLLGSVYANQWSKPLSIKENFVYTSRATIENLVPQAGEDREYRSVFEQRTGALLEDYALITVVPGVAGINTVMSLSGIYSEGTQAAAEFVTDKDHVAELNRRLQQIKGAGPAPRFYQALLKVRVENSFPTQIILVTVREL